MSSIGRLLLVYIVGLLLLCLHLCRYVRRPRLFIPSIRYVCWSHGTAGLAVLRVVTELYMIVRDLFQLSWLISWLTTARHPASFQLTLMSVSYHYWHERAIIRLVPRCHTATYKPTLLRGSLDNPSWRAHASIGSCPRDFPVWTAFVQPASIVIITATFSPTGYGLLMHCSRKQHIHSNAWHYHTLSVVHNQRCEFQITCTI